jgi:hypothetical protein
MQSAGSSTGPLGSKEVELGITYLTLSAACGIASADMPAPLLWQHSIWSRSVQQREGLGTVLPVVLKIFRLL